MQMNLVDERGHEDGDLLASLAGRPSKIKMTSVGDSRFRVAGGCAPRRWHQCACCAIPR